MLGEQEKVINIGIIGCGLIAQIMHLPHVRDNREKFYLSAICDISIETLNKVADDYKVENKYTNYHDLIAQNDIEAIMILSSGDHAPIIAAALEAGKHVFVEKPLCFSLRDADRLIKISSQHNVCLMVGYMKWFDPAYQEARKVLQANEVPGLLEITTILTPEEFYFRHHRLHHSVLDPIVKNSLQIERSNLLAKELPDISEVMRDMYVDILLDCCIHDIYVLRGLVGEPEKIVYSSFWGKGKAFHLGLCYKQELEVHYSCVLLSNPGGRYQEKFAYYNSKQRLFLDFPSPYLRNVPTDLTIEEVREDAQIVRTQIQGSFEEAFKLELLHFYDCINTGNIPLSSAIEGRKDIALMQDAIRIAAHT